MIWSLQTPLAVVGYAETWWIQILKSLVIFVVGLQLVPLDVRSIESARAAAGAVEAAASRVDGVIRFNVPSSSDFPQRPQLESSFIQRSKSAVVAGRGCA